MSDEVFRPMKNRTPEPEGNDPLSEIRKVQQAVAKETGSEMPEVLNEQNLPFKVSGNIPPEFRAAMQAKQQQKSAPAPASDESYETFEAPPERPRKVSAVPDRLINMGASSSVFKTLMDKLDQQYNWEEFKLPSKGKFYENIPDTIYIRPMTGEEEQILATPRWVRRGKAIDMIFRRCISDKNIQTEQLLSVDRTHLLIYLRGISYTPDYDVEIRCPACTIKFSTVIDLNSLMVNVCPDDFDKNSLEGILPTSKFKYSYRLATGADEQEISTYRERRIQQYGDQSDDDTLLYRTALLLEDIEGVTRKIELTQLLKHLPINDVAHLRNTVNDPPFGVDTKVPMMCPSCNEEFNIDLPLETNFFFPRKKETKTQA